MSVLEEINRFTYAVQHSPNCPSPFLVRMVGKGAGMIDYKAYGLTKDHLGFGATFEEAAEKALTAYRKDRETPVT